MKLSLPPFLLGRRFRCRHCCSGDRRLLVRAVCSVTTDDDLGQTAAASLAGAVVGQDKLKFIPYAQHVLARIVLDTIDECMFS